MRARGERAPVAVAADPPAPAPRRRRRPVITAAIGLGTAAALIAMLGPGSSRRAAARVTPPAVDDRAAASAPLLGNRAADAPPDDDLLKGPEAPAPNLPERDGEPLDDWFPTLAEWVHPVPGTREVVPHQASRFFGAPRDGVDRPECGRGHCGVDLEGIRGQPVVAVAWGTVARIQLDPNRRGGRYVRIEHPDFVYTTYFHLDAVARDLHVGDEVEPGTPLGLLGRSGIKVSLPHLHFALEIPDAGSTEQVHFIDPSPFLARAQVLPRDAVATPPSDPGIPGDGVDEPPAPATPAAGPTAAPTDESVGTDELAAP
ncbi:MAG: M23 family metallopeptidase [Kofleriaceae bacterium]|nr:M23 family metallopeptidase [Kofleriaceae bacterium]